MSFNDTAVFPRDIAFGAKVGPGYQTSIVTVNSGYESRNADWSAARLVFEAGMRPMFKKPTDDLVAFFRAVKGRAHGFRFRDWSDYQATTANGILIPAADGISLQLAKRYTGGAMEEVRRIDKPVPGTVTITGGGVVDYASGRVTGANPAASWLGEFDVPCRFDTDTMELEAVSKSGHDILFQWGAIPIIEIRL